MAPDRLPFDSPLQQYEQQAADLLSAYRAGEPGAVAFLRDHHPRFRDAEVKWLVRRVTDEEVRAAGLDLDDARAAIAEWHEFPDWDALAKYAGAVSGDPSVRRFE